MRHVHSGIAGRFEMAEKEVARRVPRAPPLRIKAPAKAFLLLRCSRRKMEEPLFSPPKQNPWPRRHPKRRRGEKGSLNKKKKEKKKKKKKKPPKKKKNTQNFFVFFFCWPVGIPASL